ncbi:MAG: phosphopyruvate hydratase [Gammaproteobacteria bacterium]|nr:phosphopyruvate hydratase [Gammaproteobacteria bacterium]
MSRVCGYEILDSRGNPTVEAEVYLTDGTIGSAAVPSGASTGIREALELRDKIPKRYLGKGVLSAVENVNTEIAQRLCGMSPFDQTAIDHSMIELDGTDKKSRLGANAILAVSMAVARAASNSLQVPLYRQLGGDEAVTLPVPYFNILNGGAHANNNIDVQEFMVVPQCAESFREALQVGVEVYHTLRKLLDSQGYSTAVGDEGGFAPNLDSNEHALSFVMEAVGKAGYDPQTEVAIALDVASSELVSDDGYYFASEDLNLSSSGLVDRLAEWTSRFPIVSIEDGMAEEDWQGWAELTKLIGDRVQLVGDDLFVTDANTLQSGIDQSVANAILVKLNQIGTVTETLQTISVAQKAKYGVMISHRSGETEDSIIADLSVATAAGQIKSGAPCRSDRTAKYNRLLKIESQLGDHAVYAGISG